MKESITSDQERQIRRIAEDAVNKGLKALTFNGKTAQQVIARGGELADAVIDKMRDLAIVCLKCISLGKRVVIPATDGTETLASADDVFNSIDPNFKNWGLDVAGEPTPQTPVEVYEMVEDGNYRHIFGGVNVNLNRLCLEQSQIKKFVSTEADNYLLKEGWTYFLFLTKRRAKTEDEREEFFVVCVPRRGVADCNAYVREVHVEGLSNDHDWRVELACRVVVPQLIQ